MVWNLISCETDSILTSCFNASLSAVASTVARTLCRGGGGGGTVQVFQEFHESKTSIDSPGGGVIFFMISGRSLNSVHSLHLTGCHK